MIFDYILTDWSVNKYNPKGRLVLILFRIASLLSRLSSAFKWIGYPYIIFYRIFVEWLLGIELPWKLKIGSQLRLYHGQALVVNDSAVIGKGCILRHSTTIGVSRTDINFGGQAPVIGNYVDIGSNVVILGGISIGDHSIIGAGSVVVNDVPPRAVVVGNPARVIKILDLNNENSPNP